MLILYYSTRKVFFSGAVFYFFGERGYGIGLFFIIFIKNNFHERYFRFEFGG